ncbi:TPA: pyruvate ferredoxin oxidoreductase subunit gamma [Candidatus Woesearchaeota archaeon]|nr:pyruvate ferredoxin oxidoreductase subunit gamma [Candidatus Woesearchaeota archaeon]
MLEIRIHGRGGQGAVTAAQLLAISAFYEGKYSQAFPRFGVERRGAPVESFCRIDDSPVHVRSQIYDPDMVLVLEPSLMDAVDVTSGLKEGGIIIVNTSKPVQDKKYAKFKVYSVDASKVALEVFKADIVNTAILGAFAKVTGLVSLDSVGKALGERFPGREAIVAKNVECVKKVFDMVQ